MRAGGARCIQIDDEQPPIPLLPKYRFTVEPSSIAENCHLCNWRISMPEIYGIVDFDSAAGMLKATARVL